MIDFDGYRPNVGIVICNNNGQVLWAKRYGQNSWQFPQGGINDNESAEQAMYRELFEEVGLSPKDVKILYVSKHWLRYKLPKRLLRYDTKPICIGQKQRWFLLQLVSDEKNINMQSSKSPEFDGWRWVSFWYPVRQVVSFKKEVYRKAMKEFATVLFEQNKENTTLTKNTEVETKPTHSTKKSSFSSKYSKRQHHKYRG
ncbi:RNA pyrophosphohydrolase [Pasteurella sp. P03HT]